MGTSRERCSDIRGDSAVPEERGCRLRTIVPIQVTPKEIANEHSSLVYLRGDGIPEGP